jgi:Tol biopolymer transport system component
MTKALFARALLSWLVVQASGGAQLADAAATGLPASIITSEGVLVMNTLGVATNDRAASTVFTVNADGTNKMTITGAGNYYPSWTPDGRIILVSLRSGQPEIWLMNADGTNARQVGNLTMAPALPEMARDGTIAFLSTSSSGSPAIMTMKSDGTDLQTVRLPTGMEPGAFSLAPSGGWIVFFNQTESPYHRELWRVNVDGTGLKQLTFPTNPNFPDANAPSISPDGRQIAFFYGKAANEGVAGLTQSVFTYGERNIGVMSADGGGITILTNCTPVTTQAQLNALTGSDCIAADNPAWTPDGGWLVYSRGSTQASGSGTWLIRAVDGEDAQSLLPYGGARGVPLQLAWLEGLTWAAPDKP